jgi:Na+/H+ antiporter NhaD/arsenite permease-like protein
LTFVPRPAIGLGAIAAALLISRVHTPRKLLERVDWPTLLLFVGLFIVTGAISSTGLPGVVLADLRARGVDPVAPAALIGLCLLGANSIGNVPLVALLLAIWHPTAPHALPALAIFSTLSGNLLLTGSVANLIVVERAASVGQRITFAMHARVGVPVTIMTIGWAYFWLRLIGAL